MTERVLVFLAASAVGLGLARADEPDRPDEPDQPQAIQTPTAQPVVPRLAAQQVDAALAALDQEPSLAVLERAALRRAEADLASVRGWRRAPNRAALLPVLKLTAEKDMERDESLDRYQDEPDRWGADTDRDLGFQVSAQWRLGELVFSPDEVAVYRALADRAERREALLTVLVSHYFERRRLQLRQLLSPPADPLAALELGLKISELGAVIDALTGGLLSRNLSNRNGKRADQRGKGRAKSN
jgi:hypothetical protein